MSDNKQSLIGRRELLKMGASLAAVPVLAQAASSPGAVAPVGTNVRPTDKAHYARAFGAASASAPIAEMTIRRRALGPDDVLIEVMYCGICHSDIHTARNEWAEYSPTHYPSVPGHEVIGKVTAVGASVTKMKVGDVAGVGCIVDACRSCEPCQDDREQNCKHGATFTYDTPDRIMGGHTYGGYSSTIVVPEHFAIRIPAGADLAAMAPLLCAGVTTFSPMSHWQAARGSKVGVIGIGGLGHMAVKLAVARGAEVTMFTTSPGKLGDMARLGASKAVLSTDMAQMEAEKGKYDLLISTVPSAYSMAPFMQLLSLDGVLVNVGAMDALQGLMGMPMAFGRQSVAGSLIGGIAETQEVIDFCAARGIKADVEVISPAEINRAYERVVNKDIKYRFVIDMTKG